MTNRSLKVRVLSSICVYYMREYFLELKAKVAVNDVNITELEEENKKLEKQYLKKKQITKG